MGNISELKLNNMLEMVKTIHHKKRISKPELARLSGLTHVSVHNLLGELLQRQLVVEDGAARSNGGRRASLYRINEQYGYVIGQTVTVHSVTTRVFNLNLELLYSHSVSKTLHYSPASLELLCQQIRLAIRSRAEQQVCLGIGVALPGQINRRSGVVINLTHLNGWKGVPLQRLLEEAFRVPIRVDNDMNAGALALKWSGQLKENDNAVLIAFNQGVGTGVIFNGQVLYGSHSNLGEIGHTTIQYDGEPCNCGNRGCIEVMTSYAALLRKAGQKGEPNEEAVERCIRMAKEGNAEIYGVLWEIGNHISLALDLIVKAYDPDTIVIQNKWLPHFPEIFHELTERLFSRCSWLQRNVLNIVLQSDDHIAQSGAGALVVNELFASAHYLLFDLTTDTGGNTI